jgi:hypothetical protein
MLKKLLLVKVVMEGFKCYKDKTEKAIDLSTIFVAGNGKGKSSIADAITWAFTGKLFEGEKQVESGFLNDESSKAVVEVYFQDEDGNERVVKRSYTVASGVSVWLDKKATTQKKLAQVVDSDKFLLSFNPLTFLGKRPTEAKKLVLDLVDVSSITDDVVISKLSKIDKKNIQGMDMSNLDTEAKTTRKSVSDKEKEIVVNNGYIVKNNAEITTMTIPEKKAPVDPKAIKEAEQKVQDLIAKKPKVDGYMELINKKGEIEKSIAEINSTKFDNSQIRNLEKDKSILEAEIKNIEKMVFSPTNLMKLEMEVNQANRDTTRIQKEQNDLRTKINDIRSEYQHKEGDECPLCSEKLTKKGLNGIKKFLETQTQDHMKKGISNKTTLEDIEKNVKGLLDKITNIKKEDDKRKQDFETNKAKKLENLNKKLKSIETQLVALKAQEKDFEAKKAEQIKPLLEQINSLNIDGAKKSIDEYEELIKVEKSTLTNLQNENREIAEFNKEIDKVVSRKNELQKEVTDYEKKISEVNKEIETLKGKINTITHFNQFKIKLIEESIKKHFDKVSFKIEEVNQETGEVTSCFKVLYDNKSIETCSLSEKIKASVEVAEMVQSILGIEYPLFLDNHESVVDIKTSITQVMRSVVVDVPEVVSIKEDTLKAIKESAKNIVLQAS